MCVLVGAGEGRIEGKGGVFGELLCSCTRVQIQGGSVQALYSVRRKEQVLNTAVPGCRKHADPGLRTPGV